MSDERFPLLPEHVPLSQTERRLLLGAHQPRYTREVDTGELPPVPPLELEIPECIQCGAAWVSGGCATVRAVLRLGVMEELKEGAERDRDAAQRYVAECGGRSDWIQRPNG